MDFSDDTSNFNVNFNFNSDYTPHGLCVKCYFRRLLARNEGFIPPVALLVASLMASVWRGYFITTILFTVVLFGVLVAVLILDRSTVVMTFTAGQAMRMPVHDFEDEFANTLDRRYLDQLCGWMRACIDCNGVFISLTTNSEHRTAGHSIAPLRLPRPLPWPIHAPSGGRQSPRRPTSGDRSCHPWSFPP
jgi:hypothetical protein